MIEYKVQCTKTVGVCKKKNILTLTLQNILVLRTFIDSFYIYEIAYIKNITDK